MGDPNYLLSTTTFDHKNTTETETKPSTSLQIKQTTKMSTSTGGHVSVFAFPFGTHAAPILTLVKRLAASSPSTTFSFFSSRQSNDKIFSGKKIQGYDNIKRYDVDDGVPEGHVFSGNPLEPIGLFLKATPANFKKSLEKSVADSGIKITCLLTDAFFGFSCQFAADLGVAWVAVWTAGASSVLAHIYADVIRSHLNDDAQKAKQTLSFVPGLSAICANDLPDEVTGSLDKPFSRLLYDMGVQIQHAAAVVLNSFEELDIVVTQELKSKVKRLLNVGFFTLACPSPSYSDDYQCISWLANQKAASVAYVSFGSMTTPPPSELMALAEALEAKKVPFLWSFQDSKKRQLLDEHFKRMGCFGKVVPWAPQFQVLEHPAVGVFITHCGWNSVAESIAGGVPMICRPFFGDQKMNRRCVEDVWQIGVSVKGDQFTKDGTEEALDVVLTKENGKKMRENIRAVKAKALKAVGDDGSSTKNFNTLLDVILQSNKS